MRTITLIFASAMIILNGCAGWKTKPMHLQVSVKPAVINPGDIVEVTVESTTGLKSVKGRLDLMGSPVVLLKQRDSKTWVWRTQVPLEAAWKSGDYHVIVEGITLKGQLVYGETWVKAP